MVSFAGQQAPVCPEDPSPSNGGPPSHRRTPSADPQPSTTGAPQPSGTHGVYATTGPSSSPRVSGGAPGAPGTRTVQSVGQQLQQMHLRGVWGVGGCCDDGVIAVEYRGLAHGNLNMHVSVDVCVASCCTQYHCVSAYPCCPSQSNCRALHSGPHQNAPPPPLGCQQQVRPWRSTHLPDRCFWRMQHWRSTVQWCRGCCWVQMRCG